MSVTYIVQFSTGLGSAECARRLINEHGAANVLLLTADTRKEDADNWRFAHEFVDHFGQGVRWVITADGRTPMQVGRDQRVVPNNRMAVCSRVLKRELLRRWIDANCDPATDIIVEGYDWTENTRIRNATPHWAPFSVAFPMAESGPWHTKASLIDFYRDELRLEPPRLYAQGFSHANCGGACTRGGQTEWRRLWMWNPDRYLEWEAEEEETRDYLGKDVAILRHRSGPEEGQPLTLRSFRERITATPTLFDATDVGACGCLMDDEP